MQLVEWTILPQNLQLSRAWWLIQVCINMIAPLSYTLVIALLQSHRAILTDCNHS
jgi:hypothetical protein